MAILTMIMYRMLNKIYAGNQLLPCHQRCYIILFVQNTNKCSKRPGKWFPNSCYPSVWNIWGLSIPLWLVSSNLGQPHLLRSKRFLGQNSSTEGPNCWLLIHQNGRTGFLCFCPPHVEIFAPQKGMALSSLRYAGVKFDLLRVISRYSVLNGCQSKFVLVTSCFNEIPLWGVPGIQSWSCCYLTFWPFKFRLDKDTVWGTLKIGKPTSNPPTFQR